MLKFKKGIVLLASTSIALALLTGCSSPAKQTVKDTSPKPSQVYTEEDAPELYSKVVDTVCALKGKSVVTQENVDSFRELAIDLKSYEGYNEKAMKDAAAVLEATANKYEGAVDIDLGPQIAEAHTEACDMITAQYESSFGSDSE